MMTSARNITHITSRLTPSEILAIYVPASFSLQAPIEFLTPDSFSQQLGLMRRPSGHVISPHIHLPTSRSISFTSEVLIIRSGRVQVDFYERTKHYISSLELAAGDILVLASGGHGFKILEEAEIIEVKQGPYAGEADKERF